MHSTREILAWVNTDVGRKRQHNEDFYLVDHAIGLYGVADGMGGYDAGDVASQMVLEGLRDRMYQRRDLFRGDPSFSPSEDCRHAIRDFLDQTVQALSYEIFSLGQKQGGDFRMGTTLCVLVTLGDTAVVVHVGDSRCYLWRGHKIFQATEDHSLVNEQLKSGLITPDEAENSRYKNVITRAVGMADRLQVDLFFVDLQSQDRFLLCSDGLHGYLQEDEIGNYLCQSDLGEVTHALIELANRRGGKDNITCIITSVEGSETTRSEINIGIELLQQNPLFREMSYSEILKLIPLFSLRSFRKGERLMCEGDRSTHLYIVQEGALEVFRDGELLATLGTSDYVGELGIFDSEPCSATVIAKERSCCLSINGAELLSALRQEPGIGFKVQQSLICVIIQRLRNTSQALAWTRQEWRRSMSEEGLPQPLSFPPKNDV